MTAESTQMAATEFTNPNLEALFSQEQIAARIRELGAAITRDYTDKELVLVSVLKGSCIFLADLMRAIDLRLTIDFMSVSSYKDGTRSTGDVEILKTLLASQVEEVRYMTPNQAGSEFGLGYEGGLIQVKLVKVEKPPF